MHPSSRHAARQQRAHLVHDAVRELLAEHGMRLSMEAVAARAGCSKQTLYAHYGNKRNLLCETMQVMIEPLTAQLDQGCDLRTALLGFAREYLEELSHPDVVHTVRVVTSECQQFPEDARQLYKNGIGTVHNRLAERLSHAVDHGVLRNDDPHFMAEMLLSMIVGLDFDRQRFQMPHRADAEAQNRWVQPTIDAFLRAFACEEPAHNSKT